MRKIICLVMALSIFFAACNSKRDVPNTDIEVARAFIKDILENNFKDAKELVLPGEANDQYFSLFKKFFEAKPSAELEQYKNADIVVNEMTPVNDSVTVVNYSNSYKKNEKNKLKVVKVNGKWLVDLKDTK